MNGFAKSSVLFCGICIVVVKAISVLCAPCVRWIHS